MPIIKVKEKFVSTRIKNFPSIFISKIEEINNNINDIIGMPEEYVRKFYIVSNFQFNKK